MFPKDIKEILLLDGIHSVCKETFARHGDFNVTVKPSQTDEELEHIIGLYDVVVVRSATKVKAKALEMGAQGRLKIVGRAGTGTDNIDVEVASRVGIVVMNTPGGNTISAAEHTCALICSLGRFTPAACASLKSGKWDRKAFMGSELYGKTLAIVGLGRIGREVATRMQSFGMKTVGYDPFVTAEQAMECNIEKMELQKLWPVADYITVHTPLLPFTKNMINEEVLTKKCKKGVKVVNVARGGIIDEEGLLKALNSEACGGAGLDVFVEEPPKDFTLCSHPKVVCTPHLGASTKEAQVRVAEEIAQQIVEAMNGKKVVGLVNAHGLSASGNKNAEEWMRLGDILGRIAAAFVPTMSENVTLDVATGGEKYSAHHKLVQNAVTAGYLYLASERRANIINVKAYAAELQVKERNCTIETNILTGQPREFLRLYLTTENSTTLALYGTVSDGQFLLFRINDSVLSNPILIRECISLYIFKGQAKLLPSFYSEMLQLGIGIQGIFQSAPQTQESNFIVFSSNSPVSRTPTAEQFRGVAIF